MFLFFFYCRVLIQRYNEMAKWVTMSILSLPDLNDRVARMSWFFDLTHVRLDRNEKLHVVCGRLQRVPEPSDSFLIF
ncbi:hypothetical protein BC828DRAFT_384739 [Blastocladiella britannica]|nr:hypothetical protein BC828DRAFT_384739 [Blastocladiella britannica]